MGRDKRLPRRGGRRALETPVAREASGCAVRGAHTRRRGPAHARRRQDEASLIDRKWALLPQPLPPTMTKTSPPELRDGPVQDDWRAIGGRMDPTAWHEVPAREEGRRDEEAALHDPVANVHLRSVRPGISR